MGSANTIMKSQHYTNENPREYITKDLSMIRELLHPDDIPGLKVSLAEAVVDAFQVTEKHYHTDSDEIYYCLEGSGILYIDDQAYDFSPQKFYLLPKNTTHYLKAQTRLRLLCFCSPAYSHEQTVLV